MATYLLDASVITDALNDRRSRRTFLLDLLKQRNLLACCPVNVAEVYAGMHPNEEVRVLSKPRILLHYLARGSGAGLLKRDHGRKGEALTIADAIIASVAISNDQILLTDNVKDFPMKELSLFPLPEFDSDPDQSPDRSEIARWLWRRL